MKKVVFFDIDYTLFDTEAFRNKMYQSIFASTRFKADNHSALLQRVYDDLVKEYGYFTPRVFLQRIAKLLPGQVDVIEKAIWDKTNFKGNFYEETKHVLTAISKHALVGIFSKGYSKKWQKTKLFEIKHFFTKDHIHITINKHETLPQLIQKYKGKKVYLVDDALEVLHTANDLDRNIFTIWVRRGKYAMAQKSIEGFKPDATVMDLREVVKLVKGD